MTVSKDFVAWRGGIRQSQDMSLAFVEAPLLKYDLAGVSGPRLGEITGMAYYGFYDAAADGLPLTNMSKTTKYFGQSLASNYPEAGPTFLRFATTYWTLRAVLEVYQEGLAPISAHILNRIDELVFPLFFPYDGPLRTPANRREADQRRFLREFGPRVDVEDFIAHNPILIRDRAREDS